MIKHVKQKKNLEALKKKIEEQKKSGFDNIELIFSVPSEKLKALHLKKGKAGEENERTHLQTHHSKIFKVLAKP